MNSIHGRTAAVNKSLPPLIGPKPGNGSRFSARSLRIPFDQRRRKMESLKVNCSKGLTYKEAGVDIDAGSELVKRIAKMAPGIGGFGGLFPLGNFFRILL